MGLQTLLNHVNACHDHDTNKLRKQAADVEDRYQQQSRALANLLQCGIDLVYE